MMNGIRWILNSLSIDKDMFICKIFYLALFCTFQVYALSDIQNPVQIAVAEASNHLGEGEFAVVPNKLAFMQELALRETCEDSFHVVDIGKLVNRLNLWNAYLPDVKPFYAVKTNHDHIIVAVLAALGTGFDCASRKEIEQVRSLGVDPSRIIFANTRKPSSSVEFSKNKGVHLYTFDSIEELSKIQSIDDKAQCVLRIKTEDAHSHNPLSSKFGAHLADCYGIIDHGMERSANLVGISFHVGSNCLHPETYEKAILDAAALFTYCKDKWGVELQLLDLGGGWPGLNDESFIIIAKKVEELLHKHFSPKVKFIAEPGRYFSTQTTSIAIRIISKVARQKESEKKFEYYLANGMYGMFLNSLYYQYDMDLMKTEGWHFKPLMPKEPLLYSTLLWGPTCDPGDKIGNGFLLPEMDTGEFIYSDNVGAYVYSLQTSFNQIDPSKPYYIFESSDK